MWFSTHLARQTRLLRKKPGAIAGMLSEVLLLPSASCRPRPQSHVDCRGRRRFEERAKDEKTIVQVHVMKYVPEQGGES